MIKKASLIILFIFFTSFKTYSQTFDERIIKGIDYIYHIKFDSAEAEFNEAIKLQPKNPKGYFFISMVDWWKINLNKENDSLDEKFFTEVDEVVEMCDGQLEKNEFDDNAMFFKGAALGYRGLVRSFRESWLKAAEDGKEALNLFQKVYEINENNKDVLFGVGLYNYFAEYVPEAYPVVKPLMLIFPKGDKLKGLLQIKQTAENSKLAKNEAKFVLAYLNLIYEKNYVEAEFYSKVLNEQYPENPIFEKYLYNSYIGQGRWVEALDGWKRIIDKSDSNQFGYNYPNLKREANYYSALCLSKLKRILESEPFIQKAEEITKVIDSDNETAYSAFIYLLFGMLNDVKGHKATANIYYDKVLSMKNFQNSHQEAERFKKEGYR